MSLAYGRKPEYLKGIHTMGGDHANSIHKKGPDLNHESVRQQYCLVVDKITPHKSFAVIFYITRWRFCFALEHALSTFFEQRSPSSEVKNTANGS